jgi:CBS domain-containing protein
MNVNCRMTTERDAKKYSEVIARERVTVLPVVDEDGNLVDIVAAYEPFASGEEAVGGDEA